MSNIKVDREKILEQKLSDTTVSTIAEYLIRKNLSNNFKETLKYWVRDLVSGVDIHEGVSYKAEAINKLKIFMPLPPFPCRDYRTSRNNSISDSALFYRGDKLAKEFYIFNKQTYQGWSYVGRFCLLELTLSELFDVSEPVYTTYSSIEKAIIKNFNHKGISILNEVGTVHVYVILHHLIGPRQYESKIIRIKRICENLGDEIERICSEQPLLSFPKSIAQEVDSNGIIKQRRGFKITLGDIINLINDDDIVGVLTMAFTITNGHDKVSNRFTRTRTNLANECDSLVNEITGYKKYIELRLKEYSQA